MNCVKRVFLLHFFTLCGTLCQYWKACEVPRRTADGDHQSYEVTAVEAGVWLKSPSIEVDALKWVEAECLAAIKETDVKRKKKGLKER